MNPSLFSNHSSYSFSPSIFHFYSLPRPSHSPKDTTVLKRGGLACQLILELADIYAPMVNPAFFFAHSPLFLLKQEEI